MTDTVNYPDILGAITGGDRCNIGVAQAALAVRPRVARAGRPFEVILLLQNACDAAVDVTTTLHLPDVDAKKQRGKFLTKNVKLVIGMAPAEVGYVVLPATTLPDTAVSDAYKVAVDVDVKTLQKPNRVRQSEGGGDFSVDFLKPEAKEQFESLQSLIFSTTKRVGRNIIEAPFNLMSGTVAQMTDFKPGWVSICRLVDYGDPRPMLHRYADLMRISILPRLKRHETFLPLLETTKDKFREADFPLHEAEAVLIAKLFTLILEYATPGENAHGFVTAGNFAIVPLIERNPLSIETPPDIPHWVQGMLQLVDRDSRVAYHPVLALNRLLFEELLFDAVIHAFDLVERETGEDLGSPLEIESYARTLASMIKNKERLGFSRVYLPLVLGGILVNDKMPASKESPLDLLRSLSLALDQRAVELGEDEAPLLDMTRRLIDRTGQKYGLRPG
jgi:hypothetical protein